MALPSNIAFFTCPNCHADQSKGFDLNALVCTHCQTTFFSLGGLPCLFPSGQHQKALWNDLFAKFEDERQLVQQANEEAQSQSGLSALTSERLTRYASVQSACHEGIAAILKKAGLSPKKDSRFEQFTPKGFVQYYELLLRDWAWHPIADETNTYRVYQDENTMAKLHILDRLATDKHAGNIKSMLVLGSGAGRLSWDLHCSLKTETCIALDFNPQLSFVAHQLIKNKSEFTLAEARRFPRQGLPRLHEWQLKCPDATLYALSHNDYEAKRAGWMGVAADAWSNPIAPQSMDLVVTPWFLDINGRDAKTLIGLVSTLLKPGGTWINYGPLLYPDELPYEKQYTYDELKQFSELAGFQCQSNAFYSVPYSHSPLVERGRVEDLWSVAFQFDGTPNSEPLQDNQKLTFDSPPPWYVMPHLPVPSVPDAWVPNDLHNILELFQQGQSLTDIATRLSATLPPEHDPLTFIYSFIDEFCFDHAGDRT